METTRTQKYWADIAYQFIKSGNSVHKVSGRDKPFYFGDGINVNGRFNLGSFKSDDFFESLYERFGDPETDKFRSFISSLVKVDAVREMSNYNTVVLTKEDGLRIDGAEFFGKGRSLDKVLLMGVDGLRGIDFLADDIKKVSDKLSVVSRDSNNYFEVKHNSDEKMIYVVNGWVESVHHALGRVERLCYESIPNFIEKETEFRNFQIKLMEYMGFDPEFGTPLSRAINSAFDDVTSGEVLSSFDFISYMQFGGRDSFFINHLIGKSKVDELNQILFNVPLGVNVSDVEYAKKSRSRIPGVLFALAGVKREDNSNGVYIEAGVKDFSENEKNGILERALSDYGNLVFSEAYYSRRNLGNVYGSVMEDVEWVVANLDSDRLEKGRLLEGKVSEEIRRVSLRDYEGKIIRDRKDYRRVKFLESSTGEKYDFDNECEFALSNVSTGNSVKAIIRNYEDCSVAIPFEFGVEI